MQEGCIWSLVRRRKLAFLVAQKVKLLPANAGYPGSIPGSGRPPGGGNGNPLLYSCLENPMDRGLQSLAGYSPWGRKEVGHDWVLNAFCFCGESCFSLLQHFFFFFLLPAWLSGSKWSHLSGCPVIHCSDASQVWTGVWITFTGTQTFRTVLSNPLGSGYQPVINGVAPTVSE